MIRISPWTSIVKGPWMTLDLPIIILISAPFPLQLKWELNFADFDIILSSKILTYCEFVDWSSANCKVATNVQGEKSRGSTTNLP
jgi:hypothetical protein